MRASARSGRCWRGCATGSAGTPLEEAGNIIGLEKNGANVSLEPGGQLELSGAPLETIHETCDEVNTHLHEVRTVAREIGVRFIGLGAAPIWTHDQMSMMPKGRYKLMTEYMGRVGTHGTQMMYRTCTVQVNLDFGSEADMVQKLRVALALAAGGHGAFRQLARSSRASRTATRAGARASGAISTRIAPACCPSSSKTAWDLKRWVDYALDVPMYFVYRDGKYIDALGQSFRDFLKGELPALPGETPTLSDWADHLTTIFPEARIKKFIEMRGADGGPWRRLCALPALWVGLLYDQTALDAAWDLVKGWDAETREGLRVAASVDGLQAEAGGVKMHDLAREVVAIAEAGLKARARPGAGGMIPDETHFLNALRDSVESGKVPADELLERYHGDWAGDLSRIYEEYSY